VIADRRVAAAVAVAAALARLPFVSRELAAWDSVAFARALDLGFFVGTDLADQRPQAPGYILYVGTAALLRPILGSPNAALVAVSVAASALACAAIYLLCRRFASRPAALVAAAVYATGPLVWSYGEIAMPYAVLGFFSALLAILFWDARHDTGHARLVASVGFGVAAGFRQDLVLLLGPLWLWMVWPRPREWPLAGVAATAGGLIWLVPSALASGGFAAYLHSVSVQSARAAAFSASARGPAGAIDNLAMIVYSLGWALAAAAPVMLVVALARLWAGRRPAGSGALFFALWVLPALIFYGTVHIGAAGYILSVVPAFAVLAGLLFDGATRDAGAGGRRVAAGIAGAAIAANVLLFVAAPTPFSAAAIADHDRSLLDRVAYVRAHYPASATVVLAQFDYIFVTWYLPEYRALFFGPGPDALSAGAPAVTVTPAGGAVLLFGPVPALPDDSARTELLPGLAALTRGSVRAYEILMR